VIRASLLIKLNGYLDSFCVFVNDLQFGLITLLDVDLIGGLFLIGLVPVLESSSDSIDSKLLWDFFILECLLPSYFERCINF